LDGKPTIVVFKGEALVGLDQKDGTELWRTPWKTDYDVNAASPLIFGADRVFISSGYNTGCALFQISGGQAKQLWKNKNLRAQINSPVPWDGRIYGIDNNASGNLVCLNAGTGDELWEERTVKGGSLIASEGKLIVLTEKGDLVVVDASTPKFRQVSRATKVLGGRCWVQPTLVRGLLYLRDNEGDLVCLQMN
jgi:outer membrane protein assembly factor BamB